MAAEDMQAGEEAARLLEGYALAVTRYQITPGTAAAPPGDAVVICGPKTAPVGAALLARDRALDMREDGGHVTVHIAGIHAIGSLGAVHYLAGHPRPIRHLSEHAGSLPPPRGWPDRRSLVQMIGAHTQAHAARTGATT